MFPRAHPSMENAVEQLGVQDSSEAAAAPRAVGRCCGREGQLGHRVCAGSNWPAFVLALPVHGFRGRATSVTAPWGSACACAPSGSACAVEQHGRTACGASPAFASAGSGGLGSDTSMYGCSRAGLQHDTKPSSTPMKLAASEIVQTWSATVPATPICHKCGNIWPASTLR